MDKVRDEYHALQDEIINDEAGKEDGTTLHQAADEKLDAWSKAFHRIVPDGYSIFSPGLSGLLKGTKETTTGDFDAYVAGLGLGKRERANIKRSFKELRAHWKGKGFFNWEMKLTQYRENHLRYVAFLTFLQDMQENDGTPSRWAASNKKEILALTDIYDNR